MIVGVPVPDSDSTPSAFYSLEDTGVVYCFVLLNLSAVQDLASDSHITPRLCK
jgi:hypothetical protein